MSSTDDFEWCDIGDGRPVRVKRCSLCNVAPSNVDDCGAFGDPNCPYFGIGEEAYQDLIKLELIRKILAATKKV